MSNSALVLYSQFEQERCAGVPRSSYVFYTADYTQSEKPNDEAWPSFYTYQMPEFDISYCGNCQIPVKGECCVNSISPDFSAPYMSGAPQIVTQSSDILMPSSANGATFCWLQSLDIGNALFGFREAYLLADSSGVCIDNHFQCFQNGTLNVFPRLNCSGTPDRLMLSGIRNVNTPILGNSRVQLLVLQTGTARYIWTAWIPSSMLVPDFKIWQERFSLSCYLMSGLLCVCMILYHIRMIVVDKRYRNMWTYWIIILFAIWSAYLFVFYWTTIFQDNNSMAIYGEFTHAFFHLATYLTTTFTTSTFVTVLASLQGFGIYMIHAAVFIVHLLLGFPKYFYWFFNVAPTDIGRQYIGFVQLLRRWRAAYDYWMVFVFVYNIVPPLLLSYMLVHSRAKRSSVTDKVKTLVHKDMWLVPCIFMQVILLGCQTTIQNLFTSSKLLGGDREYIATWGYTALVMVLHSFFAFRIALGIKIVSESHLTASNFTVSSAIHQEIKMQTTVRIVSTRHKSREHL
ncbi:hypothetical protein EDD86DRAFT_248852 [Gorgonomyces haynaldii]|nr:hypothetical protein EDD86DRAFT_248852 [Gorgonomyces haynaldii]